MSCQDMPVMEERYYIDGKLQAGESAKDLIVCNPNKRGSVTATLKETSSAQIDAAVCAAKAALGNWHLRTSGKERGDLLRKLACAVEKEVETFATMECNNVGKPIYQARGDVKCVVSILRYYAGYADKIHGQVIPVENPDKYLCYTRKEPVGVCCMILPWNYPLIVMALKIAPALACGCTCVVKPSEKSPLTALKLGQLLYKMNFPKGVVNIVGGMGPTVGEYLARHKDINFISFTGSTTAGKILSKIAADDIKRIALELGGKSPLIICEDADMEKAVKTAVKGVFTANTGQCCSASTRLVVHEKIHDEFVRRVSDEISKLTLGESTSEATDVGPLVDAIQYEKVCNYIEQGKKDGATAIPLQKTVSSEGYFVPPTLFVDVKSDMSICKEEIFGPVACVLKFSTVDEAVKIANDTDYGLGAGVITENMAVAHNIINRLKAGNVFINCYNNTDIAGPFGGFKQSGIGREFGEEGLAPYLETKTCYANIEIDEKMFKD